MRIVLPVLRYLPALGGATRLVQLIAEGAAARGHAVTVVTQTEPETPTEETIGGVRVLRLQMRRVAGFRVPRGYLRLLRSLDADLLQQNGNRIWNVDYYLPFANSFEWPQVIMPMGFYHYWMRPGPLRTVYYDWYFARRLRAFEGYFALTEGERDQVVGWGYPADQVRVIPVGIDLREFAHPPDDLTAIRKAWLLPSPRVAVYAGGFYDNKRVDRLIRAVAATQGQWGLVIAGPDIPGTPYDRAHCEALAIQLSASVRFLGPLPRPSLLAALHAADAYVQGSAFEGFGIGLLEGMAAGKPFVAFDAGAAREFSSHGAGICVGSVEEMTRALLALPGRTDEMAREALSLARKFTVDRMVEQTLELYRSVGHGDRPGPSPG